MLNKSYPKKIHPRLPIFAIKNDSKYVIYTPGYFSIVTKAQKVKLKKTWFDGVALDYDDVLLEIEKIITAKSEETKSNWENAKDIPFEPECLTVVFNNQCQLSCIYCYKEFSLPIISQKNSNSINVDALIKAAEIVAQNCKKKQKQFTFVASGGGEPTFDWDLFMEITKITKNVAFDWGLNWWGYVSTNGLLKPTQVQWISANYHLVGISIDGPPGINKYNRSIPSKFSEEILESTCLEFNKLSFPFEVRTTLTKKNYPYLKEIIYYLIEKCKAKVIRIEPVFLVNDKDVMLSVSDIDSLILLILEAMDYASEKRVEIILPDLRLHEVYSQFCNITKQNLRLTFDGIVQNCFVNNKHIIGRFTTSTSEFEFENNMIKEGMEALREIPRVCNDCINIYHCSRSCPDICLFDSFNEESLAYSVKCKFIQRLSVELVKRMSMDILKNEDEKDILLVKEIDSLISENQLIQNRRSIKNSYLKIKNYAELSDHKMPQPIWIEKGYNLNGTLLQQKLEEKLQFKSIHPLSIYLHFPYCNRKCGFCDCFSKYIKNDDRNFMQFNEKIQIEIKYWGGLTGLKERKITTVHFGGGTPNYLPKRMFEELLKTLHNQFTIDDSTEFAVESITSLITEPHLEWLKEVGFSRMHFGVQTLNDKIRKTIGRKESSDLAKSRIISCLKAGMITSVDLIYGLPFQTIDSFLSDIDELVSLGIDGISLYSFNKSAKNEKFYDKHKCNIPSVPSTFLMFVAGENKLLGKNFKKTHFVHYSKKRDKNLYYRHALRQEDLLGIGPTANGVFENLHYRNKNIEEYLSADYPAERFQGGVLESIVNNEANSIITHLMCGRISKELVVNYQFERVLMYWKEIGLIKETSTCFVLTSTGSWFISKMIEEIQLFIGS